MGYPYFNPPYNQKVNKIEEGNFFVASGGIEPDSVRVDLGAQRAKMIRFIKIAALVVGAVATVILSIMI